MNALENLVVSSITFLKSRHHPEKPHISILAPPPPRDYQLVWMKPEDLERWIDEVEGEDEDEVLEDLEESLRTRMPGWVFGSDFELSEKEKEEWTANASFSFYVRVKPDFDDESKWDESAYTQTSIFLNFCERGESRNIAVKLLLKPGGGGSQECVHMNVDVDASFIAFVVVPTRAFKYLNQRGIKEVLKKIASIGLSGFITDPSLTVNYIQIGRSCLSAKLYNRAGLDDGDYHHAFCVLVGCYGNLFKVYLINLGGRLESRNHRQVKEIYEKPQKVYTFNFSDGSSRWALGYLLEVEGKVKFSGREHKVKWNGYGLSGAYPINTLIVEKDEIFFLMDYWVSSEYLSPIRRALLPSSQFLKSLKFRQPPSKELTTFLQALSNALNDAAKIRSFYTYQEETIKEVLASLGLIEGRQHKAVAIIARTAGGKTYAFLVPILISIFCSKARGQGIGVKAILVYPTKALANDQAEEVAALLFYLKRRLSEAGMNNIEVSFGCLHGSTYDADDIRKTVGRGETPYLPVKCPLHDRPVYVEEYGGNFYARCSSNEVCDFASFLDGWMRKTREEVYFSPPDILITDEDMINRIISGTSRMRTGQRGTSPWFEWQLFGYPYVRCKACKHTYPYAFSKSKCKVCGTNLQHSAERISTLSKPVILVLDEAHQIYGSFGVQVHHMLSLLEYVLGGKPLYVLSSATLGDASMLASTLLGLSSGEIRVVSAEVEAGSEERYYQRILALIMPKAYTKDATAVRLLSKFYEKFNELRKHTPKGIIFTNTLPENNELLQHLRNAFAGSIKVDGHSTDFESERAQKELEFKAGKIDLFVATSTLELGVDYGVVDFVAIYGMPTKVSSFVQRIGRAGRNRDAAVFVILDPDSPLNYSYYENYKLLCDGNLRDEAMSHEIILISPMNEEAVKRAVKRWAVSKVHKACMSDARLCKILTNDLENVAQRRDLWSQITASISSASQRILDLPESLQVLRRNFQKYRQLIDTEIRKIAAQIDNKAEELQGISKLVELLGGDSLYNLRIADDEVTIIYHPLHRDNQRSRELRYTIRHCLHGQVTSYRGFFFVVRSVEGDRKEIKQWFGD